MNDAMPARKVVLSFTPTPEELVELALSMKTPSVIKILRVLLIIILCLSVYQLLHHPGTRILYESAITAAFAGYILYVLSPQQIARRVRKHIRK